MKEPLPKTPAVLSDPEAAMTVDTENGEIMAGEEKAQQDFREGATESHTVAGLRLLWESRWFLGGAAGGGLLLATLMAFLIPNQYVSEARLMPPDNPPAFAEAAVALAEGTAGLGGIASQLLASRNSSELLAGVLGSRTVADSLIQKFDLSKVYGSRQIEDARRQLAAQTSISVDHDTRITTIVVTDSSPERAAAMAQAYVEELNRTVREMSTSAARRERIFLEGRLQTVKQDLDSAEKEFSQFLSKNTAIDLRQPGKAMAGAPAILQGQYLAARSELDVLRRHYPDSNVRVRSLQARVAELENQLATAGGKDESAFPEKGTQGDALYPWIRSLPLLGVTYADLYRRTKTQEMLFDTLTQEYELARAQEAKEMPTVKVLDPPNLPQKKSYPPRFRFMLVGTVLGLACGVFWVFGRRQWERTDPSNPGKKLAQEVFDSAQAAMPWTSRKHTAGRQAGGHTASPDVGKEAGK
jgi:uncharacterized protein involved in exopolysaccharide biosynthesis